MMKTTKTNKHHILPRSRGGNEFDNIVSLPKKWHDAFHYLFGNLTLDEIHEFLEIIMTPNKTWSKRELAELLETLKGGENGKAI